jgi:hypothetical protein
MGRGMSSVMLPRMEQLFKIVQMEGNRDELVATAANLLIARAAYDTAVLLWPKSWIELRQGAGGAGGGQERRTTGSVRRPGSEAGDDLLCGVAVRAG